MTLHGRLPVWIGLLVLGCVAIVAYYLVPSMIGKASLYDGLNLVAVVAILWRLARSPRGGRAPWAFIAAGATMSLAGNITWDVHELFLHEPPFPSIADAFFLLQYPLLATGFLLMVRSRSDGGDRIALLDSLIVASSASALAWVFLVVPVTDNSGLGTLGLIIAGAYPLMDVVLLAVLVRLVAVPGTRSPSYLLLTSSIVSLVAADAIFGVIGPMGLYGTGSLVDAGWLFFSVALAAAAVHPSASTVGHTQTIVTKPKRRRHVFVLTATLMGPAAVVIQHVIGRPSLAVILIGSGTIVVLILIRIAEQQRTADALRLALHDVTHLSRQREALVSRVLTAQEEERKLIAREIHDDSIQHMIAVKMRIDLMRRSNPDLEAIEDFEKLASAAERSVTSLRHLMFELRPYHLDSDGLAASLGLYLDEQQTLEGSPILELDDRLVSEPSGEPRTILYRIAQEAVTNARKHAHATSLKVILEEDPSGHALRVVDDGVGFDSATRSESAPGHLGLTSMRERAEMVGGRLTLRSSPGAGTVVTAWVPRVEIPPPPSVEEVPDGKPEPDPLAELAGV